MAKPRDANAEAGNAGQGERFATLDALRGTLLLIFVGHGFSLREMLRADHWTWLTSQWVHRSWIGCSLWDLLQPGMLFIAGVAMPYSYANRQSQGQSWGRQFVHAVIRTGALVALGMYLDSYREGRLVFDLRGELQQIGLAYFLAFLVLPLGCRAHGVSVGLLLLGHTAGLVIYALLGGHDLWSPTQNLGLALDGWLRLDPHRDGVVTLNIIPATATVLLGVLVGALCRGGLSPGHKVVTLSASSLAGILVGWLLAGGDGWIDFSWYALVPMIGRLGTLSFVLTSVGWVLLFFAYFYTLMEGFIWRGWAIPLTLVGRNALLLYLTCQLFRDWAVRSAHLVLPESRPYLFSLRPLLTELIVMAIFWSLCFWLYRRRIFVKV